MRSPWLTSSDRQARDEWEDDGYSYRQHDFQLPGQDPPKLHPHAASLLNPHRTPHLQLQFLSRVPLRFESLRKYKDVVRKHLCDYNSTFQLSSRFSYGAETLRRYELPLGFPSLLLHSLPLASHPHISAYGQMLLSKQLSELANDSSSPTNVLTVQLTHVH